MAKRFVCTDLFSEDWFLDLSTESKLFYVYAYLNCDHAGILKANVRAFNALNGTQVVLDTIIAEINQQTQILRKLTDREIYIVDFISFQYGEVLNPSNRVHKSVMDILSKYGIEFKSLSPLDGANMGHGSPYVGAKEKDKEKDRDEDKTLFSHNRAGASFMPPSVEDVTKSFVSYLTVVGYASDAFGDPTALAQAFIDHYESQGWRRSNGMAVVKWEALVRQWVANEKSRAATATIQTPKGKTQWQFI